MDEKKLYVIPTRIIVIHHFWSSFLDIAGYIRFFDVCVMYMRYIYMIMLETYFMYSNNLFYYSIIIRIFLTNIHCSFTNR